MSRLAKFQISLILVCLFASPISHSATDKYQNFSQLSKSAVEGRDYRILFVNRGSPITVFAIHGGWIERGTAEFAAKIAGLGFNFYSFMALQRETGASLHLTSTHYDEPLALHLASTTRQCVSIHGFKEERPIICVGGGNVALRERVASKLRALSPAISIQQCTGELSGVHPQNIVNRCQEKGVQIELSSSVLRAFLKNAQLSQAFADAVRSGI